MKTVLLTGGSSGVGLALHTEFKRQGFEVILPTRKDLDLDQPEQVRTSKFGAVDILVNCAGHDLGGKQSWLNHSAKDWLKILNTNLISPMLLCQQVLINNQQCRVVNITSTNNNRYYANNLVYSLSKKALAEFGAMLTVDYPDINLLEVRLGLTKTNFNQNRYRTDPARYQEIYNQPCLVPDQVAVTIINAILNNHIKHIEITP